MAGSGPVADRQVLMDNRLKPHVSFQGKQRSKFVAAVGWEADRPSFMSFPICELRDGPHQDKLKYNNYSKLLTTYDANLPLADK